MSKVEKKSREQSDMGRNHEGVGKGDGSGQGGRKATDERRKSDIRHVK